jgi:hypothetical protein
MYVCELALSAQQEFIEDLLKQNFSTADITRQVALIVQDHFGGMTHDDCYRIFPTPQVRHALLSAC